MMLSFLYLLDNKESESLKEKLNIVITNIITNSYLSSVFMKHTKKECQKICSLRSQRTL